jgi:hypothetical protein
MYQNDPFLEAVNSNSTGTREWNVEISCLVAHPQASGRLLPKEIPFCAACLI